MVDQTAGDRGKPPRQATDDRAQSGVTRVTTKRATARSASNTRPGCKQRHRPAVSAPATRLSFLRRSGPRVSVTPPGVKQERVTCVNGRADRPALHPWRRGHLGAGAPSLAPRGKRGRRARAGRGACKIAANDLAGAEVRDSRELPPGTDEIHYFQEPIRRQFRFATERQSDSSRVLAEGSPGCKHERSRSGGNAVVVIPASGSDETQKT